MAGKDPFTATIATALRKLPDIERLVFLAMLDDEASFTALAERLDIDRDEAERAFAAALVHLADAIDAPPPGPGISRWLRRTAALARLARRRSGR